MAGPVNDLCVPHFAVSTLKSTNFVSLISRVLPRCRDFRRQGGESSVRERETMDRTLCHKASGFLSAHARRGTETSLSSPRRHRTERGESFLSNCQENWTETLTLSSAGVSLEWRERS